MRIPLTLVILFTAFTLSAQWNPVQMYPGGATDGAFSFVIDGVGYVGGGYYNKHFYSYDPQKDSWKQLADVPSEGPSLSHAFSFAAGGKGYVGGGSNPTSHSLTRNFYQYDPSMDEWTQLAHYKGGQRAGCFSFVIGSKGYVGGGYDTTLTYDDFYEYDIATDKWTALDDFLGGPVKFACGFAANGHGYAGGGGQGKGHQANNGIYRYDTTSGGWWTYETTLPGEGLQAATCFMVDGKVVWGGGTSNYEKTTTEFWVYDPATQDWTFLTDAFPNELTAWSTAMVMGEKACVGLGSSFPTTSYSDRFYVYDFANSTGIASAPAIHKFTLAPNPVSSTLYLNSDLNLLSFSIFDLSGRLLTTQNNLGVATAQVDVSMLPKGIYQIRIITPDGIHQERFIKN